VENEYGYSVLVDDNFATPGVRPAPSAEHPPNRNDPCGTRSVLTRFGAQHAWTGQVGL
jgi:hypothetical protein